jgi:hypothetical protein
MQVAPHLVVSCVSWSSDAHDCLRCTGLRLPAKVPPLLLHQLGAAAATSGLTYLRLGHTPWPQLEPLRHLAALERVHLHVSHAALRPLSSLTGLTYLHLHGAFEDLPRALPRLKTLKKLSLGKMRRVRGDDVRAIGRLASLTALDLPVERACLLAPSVEPLSRLQVRRLSSPLSYGAGCAVVLLQH